MADRRQVGSVELRSGVDAVVRRAERQRGIICETRRGRVGAAGRTREPPVVERVHHGAVGGDVQVRLQRLRRTGVVVHLDRRRPRLPAVERRGQVDDREPGRPVLVGNVERVVAVQLPVPDGESVDDPLAERGVLVGRDVDLLRRDVERALPRHAPVLRPHE